MRWLSIAAFLVAMTTHARADVFEIDGLDSFEECMQLDDLIETTRTADGSQTRLRSAIDIQNRCISSAAQFLAATKDKDTIMHFVEVVKRLSASENALALIDLVIRISLPSCDDLDVYEVMVTALEHPDRPRGGHVFRAKMMVTRCLKDKAFRRDFVEELQSRNRNLAANACDILVQEKLVSSCTGTKP
jgi:hypothetical protein